MGYVVAAFFGVIFGNFATTYFHRIPLGKPINGRNNQSGLKPHCSNCGHELKFYEYLPVLSWVFSFGKCNYCRAKIDPAYYILEICSTLYAILLNHMIGISYLFIPSLVLGISILLSTLLFIRHQKIYFNVILTMLICLLLITFEVYYGFT